MNQIILCAFLLAISLSATMFAQAPIPRLRVSVPDINGRAVLLVKPAFPDTAVAVGADGDSLSLKVVVDESGNVISAECSTTCHPMLKEAAELAAITSKFKPLLKDGQAVKYQGILHYTFVVNRVDWYRFGTAIESTVQFDNISLGPVAQILSSEFAAEKARLITIDAGGGVDFDTRQKVMTEVIGTIKSKLKGEDLWRFEIGMALRRITFWTMAGGPINRVELQKAFDELPKYIASAPDDTPERVGDGLTAFFKYRIPTEIAERELRQALKELSRKLPRDLK